jgi:hypothetical protein
MRTPYAGAQAGRMRRSPLADLGVAAAVLLATLGGAAAAWWVVYFQLFGEVADRTDHDTAALVLAGTGLVVAVLGFLTCLSLRTALWVQVTTAVCAGGLLLGALDQHTTAQSLSANLPTDEPINTALVYLLGVPTSWPLAVLALYALVVAVARPARPSAPPQERVGA